MDTVTMGSFQAPDDLAVSTRLRLHEFYGFRVIFVGIHRQDWDKFQTKEVPHLDRIQGESWREYVQTTVERANGMTWDEMENELHLALQDEW